MEKSHQTVGRFVLLLPVGMQDYTVSLEISTDEPRSYPGGCKEILRAVERVLKMARGATGMAMCHLGAT